MADEREQYRNRVDLLLEEIARLNAVIACLKIWTGKEHVSTEVPVYDKPRSGVSQSVPYFSDSLNFFPFKKGRED